MAREIPRYEAHKPRRKAIFICPMVASASVEQSSRRTSQEGRALVVLAAAVLRMRFPLVIP
jgi:hypothetical protein